MGTRHGRYRAPVGETPCRFTDFLVDRRDLLRPHASVYRRRVLRVDDVIQSAKFKMQTRHSCENQRERRRGVRPTAASNMPSAFCILNFASLPPEML